MTDLGLELLLHMLETLAEDAGELELWHGEGSAAYNRCRARHGVACDRCRRGHRDEQFARNVVTTSDWVRGYRDRQQRS